MYNIVGILEKSFTFDDKSTGMKRSVHGYQVFCMDDSRAKVEGFATFDFFMSDSVCDRSNYNPKVGDSLEALSYNRFGRLDRVFPSSV